MRVRRRPRASVIALVTLIALCCAVVAGSLKAFVLPGAIFGDRPALSAAPREVMAGNATALTLTGRGFGLRTRGVVTLNDVPLVDFQTGWTGTFVVEVTIPAQLGAGTIRVAARTDAASASAPLTVIAPISDALALGAYIPGAPWEPTKIDRFAQLVGTAPSIVSWYQSRDGPDPNQARFDPVKMRAITSRGAMPMVTWEPWDARAGVAQPAYALRAIVAGRHDAYIRQWARDAAAWGQPFYLRFAHEMNTEGFPWSARANGNTAEEYVAAWRHVHALFRQEGAANIRWVWCANVHYEGLTPFAEVYPGDAYVDWVALDGYNWGDLRPPTRWASLAEVFAPSYAALTALTDKPVLLAELASTEAGGDKAAWIAQGLLADLPARFPRVRAVVWFHEDTPGQADWRVDSSPAALAAFRRVAAAPAYHGRLP